MDQTALLEDLKGQGRTREQFADHIGMSQQVVSDWFRGTRAIGKIGLARLLACYPERQDELIAVCLSGAGARPEEVATNPLTPV